MTTEAEINLALKIIAEWRRRLVDISWFMRALNEFIARKANKEDNCKGRFWEGRFKSQALLDEQALLTCMAYVDLNPVRTKMTKHVEQSEYTSIFERIHGVSNHAEPPHSLPNFLYCFAADELKDQPQGIPYALADYLELVDWTSRVIRDDKNGMISVQEPNQLRSLNLDSETWLALACGFGKDYHGAVGTLDELAEFAAHTGKRWISGKSKLQRMLH